MQEFRRPSRARMAASAPNRWTKRAVAIRLFVVAIVVGALPTYRFATGDFSKYGLQPDASARFDWIVSTFLGPLTILGHSGFMGLDWMPAFVLPVAAIVLAWKKPDRWWARLLGYFGVALWVLTGAMIVSIGF